MTDLFKSPITRLIATTLLASVIFVFTARADGVQAVDINQADADLLATQLTGVGEHLGAAIVMERDANGPFVSADDLQRVHGIGDTLIERNRDRIIIDGGARSVATETSDKEPGRESN